MGSMRYILFTAAAGVLTSALLPSQSASTFVGTHTDTLQKASGVSITLTAQKLSGDREEWKLVLGRPRQLRMETASRIVVSDGSKVWEWSKSGNTYTEAPFTDAWLMNASHQPQVLVWSAFFDPLFAKGIASARLGKTRTIKGQEIKEVILTLSKMPGATLTLWYDEKLKAARGGSVRTESGESSEEVLIQVSSIEFGAAPEPSQFQFAPPLGATKVEAPRAGSVTFDQVQRFFSQNCTRCHSGGQPKAGLNLSGYEGIMAGSHKGAVVVAGQPDNSRVLQVLRPGGSPKMPPQGSVSKDNVDMLAKWIADGAKPN